MREEVEMGTGKCAHLFIERDEGDVVGSAVGEDVRDEEEGEATRTLGGGAPRDRYVGRRTLPGFLVVWRTTTVIR
jgi:hypothetical protein